MTNHPENVPQEKLILDTKKSAQQARVFFWIVLGMMLTSVTLLGWYFLYQPAPAVFQKAEILTPMVIPTGKSVSAGSLGNVQMEVKIQENLSQECLITTKYFIQYASGRRNHMPGERSDDVRDPSWAMYEVSVPLDAPVGPAKFYVRELYICGFQIKRAESPHMPFIVGAQDGTLTPNPDQYQELEEME